MYRHKGAPCWVYFARSECGAFIKIGRTCKPETKEKNLWTATRAALGRAMVFKIFLIIPGDDAMEGEFCHRFTKYLVRPSLSEWFHCNDEILSFAESLRHNA